jgi:hypothetical protein
MSLSASSGGGFPSARSCGLACVLFLLFSAVTQAGVISLTSQMRFVDVNTNNVPGVVVSPADHRQDAPDFGPFHGSVSLSYPFGVDQTARQDSTLTVTPDGMGALLDAHGALVKSISDNGLNGTSHFQVNFDLTAAVPYHLIYNGREGDPRFDNLQVFVPGMFFGPSAPGPLTVDPHTGNFFDTVTFSGTLQPGSYQLRAELSTLGFASFDMTLAMGTSAVPLPPAFWAALTVLPLLFVAARPVRKLAGL